MRKIDWWKSKTLWIAVAQAVAGIIAVVISENPELQYVGVLVTVKSVLDFYLRYTTNRAIK
jgi:purine-cytosine permease-like protein